MDMISYLVEHKMMLLQQKAKNWKQAIKIGTDLMVERGIVSPEYYDGILANVKKYGLYFAMAPGVAMPHARPEQGALETGFALVTLAKPVKFKSKECDPIHALFFLAAKDTESMNKEGIVPVMEFIDDGPLIELLKTASSEEEIKSYQSNQSHG